MTFIKEKLPIIIGIIVFILLCGFTYYYLFEKEMYYYTQIDNSKVEELDSKEDMQYKYTLTMYDKNAHAKEISFKTSRILREEAFLKIKYYNIFGVNNWQEVEYEELPDKVKAEYEG